MKVVLLISNLAITQRGSLIIIPITNGDESGALVKTKLIGFCL